MISNNLPFFVCLVCMFISTLTLGHEGPKRILTEANIVRRGSATCLAFPNEIEGPYYVKDMPFRSNITEGRPGIPLKLFVTVLDLATCLPATETLIVDIWHCDAFGVYSHFEQASKNVQNAKTDNSTYFRGKQYTNSSSTATFDTIYPGWYTGRDDHIHVKIWKGETEYLTSQFSFNDSFTDYISQIYPYTLNTNPKTNMSSDMVFADNAGLGTIEIVFVNSDNVRDGLLGFITTGVNTTHPAAAAVPNFNSQPPGAPPNGTFPGGRPPIGSIPRPFSSRVRAVNNSEISMPTITVLVVFLLVVVWM